MQATTHKYEHIVFTLTRKLKDFFKNTKYSVHSSQVVVKLQQQNSTFECVPDIFVECDNKFIHQALYLKQLLIHFHVEAADFMNLPGFTK
jgi:hypothetical protein